MEIFYNFKVLFLSVWNKGILGVDIFQILIGIGIFLIFLIFRGIISKVIIKKLDNIAKRTSNKLDNSEYFSIKNGLDLRPREYKITSQSLRQNSPKCHHFLFFFVNLAGQITCRTQLKTQLESLRSGSLDSATHRKPLRPHRRP